MAPGDQDSGNVPPAPAKADAPVPFPPAPTKPEQNPPPSPQGDSEHCPCRLLAPSSQNPAADRLDALEVGENPSLPTTPKTLDTPEPSTNHLACASRATRTPCEPTPSDSPQSSPPLPPECKTTPPLQKYDRKNSALDHAPYPSDKSPLPSLLYLRKAEMSREK